MCLPEGDPLSFYGFIKTNKQCDRFEDGDDFKWQLCRAFAERLLCVRHVAIRRIVNSDMPQAGVLNGQQLAAEIVASNWQIARCIYLLKACKQFIIANVLLVVVVAAVDSHAFKRINKRA